MTFTPFPSSNAASNPTVPRLPTLPNEIKIQIFQDIITSSLPLDEGIITISPPPTTGLEVRPASKGFSTILRLSRHWSFVIHKQVYESVVFHLSGRAMRREFNRATSYTRLNLLSHWSFSPYISPHIKTIYITLDGGYWAFEDRKLRRTLRRFPNLGKLVFTVPSHPWRWWRELLYLCTDTLDFVPSIEMDVEPDPDFEFTYRVMTGVLEGRNRRKQLENLTSETCHPA